MARPAIKDEFSDLRVSRQRKYQLRKQRDGRCTECGAPAEMGARCLQHLVRARERQRALKGTQRRYRTLSYRLEEMTQKTGGQPARAARNRKAARQVPPVRPQR